MGWPYRLLNLMRTGRLNREIDRELAFHIAECADALRAAGMSESDALRAARRRLGNAEVQRERTRDADVIGWLDSLVRDVRHAVRGLRRAPMFATIAIASLALGIGANTAIFTLIDAVVLRPLPVPAPEELVILGMAEEEEAGWFTNPLWEQIRDRQSGLSAVAAFSGGNRLNIASGGEARRVRAVWASGDYFRLFGTRPAVGRLLTAADDQRGCAPIAVLGHGFWQSEYGGDPSVVGRRLTLESTPFEVVGVAANGFRGAEVGSDPQVYLPLCARTAMPGSENVLEARSSWYLTIMGRRARGVTLAQASARLAAIAPASYAATVPQNWAVENQQDYGSRSFYAYPAEAGVSQVRSRYTGALLMLMAGVGLVLLIACANVANLLLARAATRQREFAIRVAIGAGRRRLIRQLVTESLLFAVVGAALGLLVARVGAHGLVELIAQGEPVALDLSLSGRVLAFTAAMAVLTTLVFGLAPAWQATRVDPQTTMRARGRSIAEGHGRFTTGKMLVAAQVALSLVLLVGAGLLVGSLRNLTTLDPGFTADGVLLASADLRGTGFERERMALARRTILERVRRVPGVTDASSSDLTPISGSSWNDVLVVDGYAPASERDALVWFNGVSEGYFTTLGIRILAGRDFNARDVPEAARVAIVSESVVSRFFGGRDPIGEEFRTPRGDDLSDPYTIVGVVEDARYRALDEASSSTVFVAASQSDRGPFVNLEVRANGDPAALVPSVKAALADVHPAIVLDFRTLSDQIAGSLQRERMLAVLSALFGGVALALAVLGLYGVMSYAVARRRNEIGVRIALGADRGRVLRMVLGDVGHVVAVGLIVGTIAATASGRLVGAFLFGMEPGEPAVLVAAAAVLALVALCAGLIPAWRAARMDPTMALREE